MSGKKRKITGLSHELVTRDVKKEKRASQNLAAIIVACDGAGRQHSLRCLVNLTSLARN